ncbi:MAG: hypothetical protein R6U89_10580 [Dehalococcoidia bacterium]
MDIKGHQRWNLKTDSPERVLKTFADAIEDTGYKIVQRPSKERIAACAGAYDFNLEVAGRKIVARYRPLMTLLAIILIGASIGLFVVSIPGDVSGIDIFMMIIGVIFAVLGILFGVGSPKLFRLSLVGRVKRDSLDMAPDAPRQMVVAEVLGGREAIWRKLAKEAEKPQKIPREQRILLMDFQEVLRRVEIVLPSITEE